MRRTGKPRSRRLRISVLALFAGFILAGCDIAIEQTASSGQVTVGEKITYTISGSDLDDEQQIQNPTPPGEPPIPKEGESYSALIGKATLPAGVAFVSASPVHTADGSFCARPDANRVVRCFLAFRKASENNAVKITVRATEAGEKTTTTEVFDEVVHFETGAEYPFIQRQDPETDSEVQIRVDPETGLFLDPDFGYPLTNDRNFSNNADTTTTEVLPDTTAPRVTSGTKPANKATGVARNVSLTATFSEAMAKDTITKSTFKLFKVNPDGTTRQITNVAVGLSSTGLKAKLDPFGASTTLLAKNAKYKAVITTEARDRAGNRLDQNPSTEGNQPKVWTFTTGSS